MKIITKGVTVRSGGVEYPPGSAIDIDGETAARMIARGCATEAPAEAMVAIEVKPDGTLSPEITGDGSGESLPEALSEASAPAPESAYQELANDLPDGYKSQKPKRGKA